MVYTKCTDIVPNLHVLCENRDATIHYVCILCCQFFRFGFLHSSTSITVNHVLKLSNYLGEFGGGGEADSREFVRRISKREWWRGLRKRLGEVEDDIFGHGNYYLLGCSVCSLFLFFLSVSPLDFVFCLWNRIISPLPGVACCKDFGEVRWQPCYSTRVLVNGWGPFNTYTCFLTHKSDIIVCGLLVIS